MKTLRVGSRVGGAQNASAVAVIIISRMPARVACVCPDIAILNLPYCWLATTVVEWYVYMAMGAGLRPYLCSAKGGNEGQGYSGRTHTHRYGNETGDGNEAGVGWWGPSVVRW